MLDVVYFGNYSAFGLAPLPALQKHARVVGVVEAGYVAARGGEACFRGPLGALRRRLFRHSPYLRARAQGIPATFWTKARVDEVEACLRAWKPDLAVVASFPGLLPERILSIPRLGFVNIHPSALPLHRGPDPVSWIYLEGHAESAMTLHRLDAGEDTGDILAQVPIAIPADMGPARFLQVAMDACLEKLPGILAGLEEGTLVGHPQAHLPCPQRGRRLKKGEDPYRFAEWSLDRCARALHLLGEVRPAALTEGGAARKAWRATGAEAGPTGLPTGTLQKDDRGWFLVHPEGKLRVTPVSDWKGALKGRILKRILG